MSWEEGAITKGHRCWEEGVHHRDRRWHILFLRRRGWLYEVQSGAIGTAQTRAGQWDVGEPFSDLLYGCESEPERKIEKLRSLTVL